MSYLVAKGTRAKVITPCGRVIDPYTCRQDSTFTDPECRGHGLHLQFERDGFKLIVARQCPWLSPWPRCDNERVRR
jgi:hypothetical protein